MESKGHSLLLLLPSERKMIEELHAKKVLHLFFFYNFFF